MKKLITIILSTAIAFSAFALENTLKQLTELRKTQSYWPAIKNVVDANKDVLAKNFDTFKVSDDANYSVMHLLDAVEIEKTKLLTADKRKARQRLQHIYLNWSNRYATNDQFRSMPVRAQFIINCRKYHELESIDNTTYYEELKAKDYKVNNIKLPLWTINALAKFNSDWSYFGALDVNNTIITELNYVPGITNWLLTTDIDTAQKKCEQLINKLILKDQTQSKEYKKYKAIQAELIARKINSKL